MLVCLNEAVLIFIIFYIIAITRYEIPLNNRNPHWIFQSSEELERLRCEANSNAIERLTSAGKIKNEDNIISQREELCLVRTYLANLKEFYEKFQPPMKKSVIATAFIYMKRFYLLESCTDYHPRNIGITCAYLACKVDEFNVTIDQFVKNVKGNIKKAQETVISNELLVMKKLKFHLTVHLPYRAVQGFLIDMRVRNRGAISKTDLIAEDIEDFLDKCMYTDACFLFSPSQIALAAICHAAEKHDIPMEPYLEDTLFLGEPTAMEYFRLLRIRLANLIDRDAEYIASNNEIRKIEKKLIEIGL